MKIKNVAILFLVLFILCGCTPKWMIQVRDQSALASNLTYADYEKNLAFADENGAIPLERLLWTMEFNCIDSVSVSTQAGEDFSFNWRDVAATTKLSKTGQISVNGQTFEVSQITLTKCAVDQPVNHSIYDLAPTLLSALGVAPGNQMQGKAIQTPQTTHALLIVVDGMGETLLQQALQQTALDTLGSYTRLPSFTTYPPVTAVVFASLYAGVHPQVHGLLQRGTRSINAETIFDLLSAQNKTARIIEGESTPVLLPGYDILLNADRNNDGDIDAEILDTTLTAIQQQGLPDLLVVHFHGLDDQTHSFGPESDQFLEQLEKIDQYIAQLLATYQAALPKNGTATIIITADHGGHTIAAETPYGDHGNLIIEDMLIPIIIFTVTP